MPLPKNFPRTQSAKAKDDSKRRILANRYRVDKRLGSGSFGTVWLVTDLKTKDIKEQLKVLKEIPVGELQPDETVDAMHEANLLRNLDHPGITKFSNSFIEGEYFCIVTEYCEGGDLDVKIHQYKKQGKSFEEGIIVEWLIQLLLAVQYMHSRRVLHRDLKTRNIFLRNNVIKVGDFGISRILMGTTDMASTFTGTPYYMSPEVLKHEGYNSKSDVWSVGCMLYELVALEHAFEGQSLMGVMYKIVEGNLPEWPNKYSEDLAGVFYKLLEKDPAKRPSASEALKLPFIAKQMEQLKNTMMDKHQAKEQKESIAWESEQLVIAMKQKSNLGQLKKESEELCWKNMSPREKMRLRKQQKADEEADRLRAASKQQLHENKQKYEANRTTMNAYRPHTGRETYLGGEGRKRLEQNLQNVHEEPDHGDYQYQEPEICDVEPKQIRSDTNVSQNDDMIYFTPVPQEFDDHDDDEDIVYHNTVPEQYLSPQEVRDARSRPYATMGAEDRPITPMRDTMVYDVKHSSLDFKDGIPDKAELAETYYSQFEDEFEEEEEDDGEATLVETVVCMDDEEVGDLISCMENALDKSETIKSTTLIDDTITGAFGPTARDTKVKNIKTECINKLGKDAFERAYDIIKNARFGGPDGSASHTVNENELMKELRKVVKNPSDCFQVEQLLFLEEQAKIA